MNPSSPPDPHPACDHILRVVAEAVRVASLSSAGGASAWLSDAASGLAGLVAAMPGCPFGAPEVRSALVRLPRGAAPVMLAGGSSLFCGAASSPLLEEFLASREGFHDPLACGAWLSRPGDRGPTHPRPAAYALAVVCPCEADLRLTVQMDVATPGEAGAGVLEPLRRLLAGLCPTFAAIFAERVWGPLVRRRAVMERLTPMQREIANFIADGHTDRQIASILARSPHTVRGHVKIIFDQLGVSSRADLTRAWLGRAVAAPSVPNTVD